MTASVSARVIRAVGHGLTPRQIDHWRRVGALGEHRQRLGSGRRDHFTEHEIAKLIALSVVAQDFNNLNMAYGVPTELIARLWRELDDKDTVTLHIGRTLTVTASLAPASDQEATP